MSKVRVILNKSGVRQLLQSKEMQSIVEERASATVNRLGEGYEMTSMVGKNRVNARVEAIWYQTRADNLENNTILKALK